MQKLLSEDEKLRKSIEQMQKFLNDRLDQCSPGAYFKANLEKEGEFFVHTPSRKLDLKSINTLGMLMDSLTVVGEPSSKLLSAPIKSKFLSIRLRTKSPTSKK